MRLHQLISSGSCLAAYPAVSLRERGSGSATRSRCVASWVHASASHHGLSDGPSPRGTEAWHNAGMASWASSAGVRRSMISNKARDTAPEVALRAALHRAGLRFFKHRRAIQNLSCTPDAIFPQLKIAVFLDGCYWHGCPLHASLPKTNGAWWLAKLEENKARDRRHNTALESAGWVAVRFWEHESPDDAAATVKELVLARRRGIMQGTRMRQAEHTEGVANVDQPP
jgi:DNA mismatch endonuclease (patch repair protein)